MRGAQETQKQNKLHGQQTESKGLKEKHEPGRGWQKPLVKPEPQRTTRGE